MSGVEVYYFSGTGNSLAVARDIAQGLHGKLLPMTLSAGERTLSDDTVGVVFPAYMAHLYGLPLIVERFIEGIENIESKYIFAVCTCGGLENFNALPALKSLARLVRRVGGKVSCSFSIRLPMNTLDYSHIPVPVDQDRGRMFGACEMKVPEICRSVARKVRRREPLKTVLNWFMTPLYLVLRKVYYGELRKNAREPTNSTLGFRELVPLTDRSISADENCRSCSTCASVCPVGNIEMRDGRPAWLHHCEMCLACAEWCPNGAIHHGSRAHGKHYRHPSVDLGDMIEQANRHEVNNRV
jgi:formate hydrogenlyase subunit 6/NADH:ubiquinone oxidoreductase subunit I/flavodoxin